MRFGQPVLVKADLVRVRATVGSDKETLSFAPDQSRRNYARYASSKLVFPAAKEWPGQPVHPDALPKLTSTALEPLGEDARATVRMRRFPYPAPVIGVVIGWTWKEEGRVDTIHGQDEAYEAYLMPYRRVDVVEVALQGHVKAHIVMCLAGDLVELDE